MHTESNGVRTGIRASKARLWGRLSGRFALLMLVPVLLACAHGHHHGGTLQLTPLGNSAASNEADLQIVSPADGQAFAVGEAIMLELSVSGFELGVLTEGSGENGLAHSAKGQHIHLILDNGPYKAIYDTSAPINLNELYGGQLAPGVHTIVAFASRSWHESVKSPGAAKALTFYVGSRGKIAKLFHCDPLRNRRPRIAYSRPKGTYSGDGAKTVMVDFYLTNATLSPNDYKVKVTLDGKDSAIVDSWQPYAIEGLEPGEHEVTLRLIGRHGHRVHGRYNKTKRTITVE